MATIPFKQSIAADLANDFGGITVGQGSHAKAHVTQDLDMDTSKTKSDQRTKERIYRCPNHQLHTPKNHWLDQNAFHRLELSVLGQAPANRLISASHRALIAEIQAHPAHFGLVNNLLRSQLHRDRIAHAGGQPGRLLRAAGDSPARQRKA